jgi:hypothetical protein
MIISEQQVYTKLWEKTRTVVKIYMFVAMVY